jgi:hypothetical protein
MSALLLPSLFFILTPLFFHLSPLSPSRGADGQVGWGVEYRWPTGPRPDGPAHGTAFWPGPSTARPVKGRARAGPARLPGRVWASPPARHDGPQARPDT